MRARARESEREAEERGRGERRKESHNNDAAAASATSTPRRRRGAPVLRRPLDRRQLRRVPRPLRLLFRRRSRRSSRRRRRRAGRERQRDLGLGRDVGPPPRAVDLWPAALRGGLAPQRPVAVSPRRGGDLLRAAHDQARRAVVQAEQGAEEGREQASRFRGRGEKRWRGMWRRRE